MRSFPLRIVTPRKAACRGVAPDILQQTKRRLLVRVSQRALLLGSLETKKVAVASDPRAGE